MVYYVANILQIYETEEKIPQGGKMEKYIKRNREKRKEKEGRKAPRKK